MKNKKLIKVFASCMFFACILILNSCEKDPKDDHPRLPPLESFFIDFSDFGDPSDTLDIKKALPLYNNWAAAFANVSFWNALATISVALPASAYVEALKQKPVYLGDDRWEWKCNFNFNSNSYWLSLKTHHISDEYFAAEMYISSAGKETFTEFKWFEGTIRYDLTRASWILYESPLVPEQFLSIEWNYDNEIKSGNITYTIIKANDPEKDSFISYMYSSDNSLLFNSSYTVSLSSGLVLIEWNNQTRAGRIKNPLWFKDDLWHCWNRNLQDDICED